MKPFKREISKPRSSLSDLVASDEIITGLNKKVSSDLSQHIDVACTHLSVNIDEMLDKGGLWADTLYGNLIQEFITAFAAQRGYTSSVTVENIGSYIQTSMYALAALTVLHRQQNLADFKDRNGRDVSYIYTNLFDSGLDTVVLDGLSDSTTTAVTAVGTSAISNATWAKTYLSELSKIRVPKGLFNLMDYLFSNVFQDTFADSAVDTDIMFWPITIMTSTATTTPETAFSNAITSLNSLINSTPDILAILDSMGITSELVEKKDWTRDLTGRTMSHVLDFNIETLLMNSWVYLQQEFTSSDLAQDHEDTVFIPLAPNHIYNYEDMYAIKMSDWAYYGYLRDYIYLANINWKESDGTEVTLVPVLPGSINYGSTISATGANVLTQLSEAMALTELLFGNLNNVLLKYTAADTNFATITTAVDGNILTSGVKGMELSEAESDGIDEVFATMLIFGAKYRQNVNELLSHMKPYIKRG